MRKKPHISSLINPNFNLEEHKKEIRKLEDQKKREREKEEQRIKDLKCPCCENTKKQFKRLSFRNGPLVCGGRNSSTTLGEYYICLNCGTMYVDLLKLDK